MKTMHKFLAVVISAALAAGLLAGCGAASSTASSAASSEAVSSVAVSSEAASSEAASGQAEDAKVKAEFTVTGADGESQTFTLEVTDGEKLSDALVEAGLISEEEAAAGFVTTVNGETDRCHRRDDHRGRGRHCAARWRQLCLYLHEVRSLCKSGCCGWCSAA